MKNEEIRALFKKASALLSGHFELRSGLHSNQFFQCAQLLQQPRVAEKLCAALAEKMKGKLSDMQIDTVVAPAMGGIVIGHDMARALDKRFIFVEKENHALSLRRFKVVPGERFVVVEDVVTRGGRVQETIDIVEGHGGKVVAAGVLVDRSGGKVDFALPLVSLLQIEAITYEPEVCPLCYEGVDLVHPGSK